MMKGVNAKESQMVAALSIDRLGRSLTDLLAILQALHDKGVDLFLHQRGLDTSTTAGRAMFQMLGVFAEFERGIIRERVNAGLARAREKGMVLGRPPDRAGCREAHTAPARKGNGRSEDRPHVGDRYKRRAARGVAAIAARQRRGVAHARGFASIDREHASRATPTPPWPPPRAVQGCRNALRPVQDFFGFPGRSTCTG